MFYHILVNRHSVTEGALETTTTVPLTNIFYIVYFAVVHPGNLCSARAWSIRRPGLAFQRAEQGLRTQPGGEQTAFMPPSLESARTFKYIYTSAEKIIVYVVNIF